MRLVRATNASVTDEVTALSHVFLSLLEAPTPPPSVSFLKPTPSIDLWVGPCRSACLTHPIGRSVILRSPVSVGKRTVGRNYIASRGNCHVSWAFRTIEQFGLVAARPSPLRAPRTDRRRRSKHARATPELLLRGQPPHAAGIGLPGRD